MTDKFWIRVRDHFANSDPVAVDLSHEDGELIRAVAANRALGSCATCKWAEANGTDLPFSLVCMRPFAEAPLFGNDGGRATLVAPTFGCVSWEAK